MQSNERRLYAYIMQMSWIFFPPGFSNQALKSSHNHLVAWCQNQGVKRSNIGSKARRHFICNDYALDKKPGVSLIVISC